MSKPATIYELLFDLGMLLKQCEEETREINDYGEPSGIRDEGELLISQTRDQALALIRRAYALRVRARRVKEAMQDKEPCDE